MSSVVEFIKTRGSKRACAYLKNIFDHSDLWFKGYLALSRRRISPLKSCFSFLHESSPVLVKVAGVTFQIDCVDGLQRRIVCGLYETECLKLILSKLNPDGVYLDIGANVGFYGLQIASKLSEKGKVFAIEANPANFKQLQRNISLNKFVGVIKASHLAISDKNESLNFYLSEDRCSGAGSLNQYKDFGNNAVSVNACSLDAYFKEHDIEKVECAKIDIEGAEYLLLQGATVTLAEKKIHNFLIEYNGIRLDEIGVSFIDFYQPFLENGYVCTYNQKMLKDLLSGALQGKTICTNFMFSLV